ncbi:cytochrome c biogenesis protein CcsA [Armatimonas sp.]|uniref:cytochrome c biogenesis protein CcsA n=1 Tax=Armatimonas sp. TaxID=1872638 RepID=UPI00374D5C65
MPLGYTLLGFALAATVIANVLFVLCGKADRTGLCDWAKRFVALATTSVIGACAYLAYLIATHQFQVHYVAEYTSRRTKTWYLMAAFWGGQEGSMLLWAFWTAMLGLWLAYKGGKNSAKAWPIFGIAQVYLLSLILVKCPFAVPPGPIPADGRGLNPSLENYWMVIHPPILFLGFASTILPSVWAIYGMLHRDWDGWVKSALPCTLFSFATLGFGLSLGGYWAYETLGWGGFWAWDPVENTSLFPWLLLTSLLHGLVLQNKNGSWRKANFFLGILPFAAMFYGTFLTRTGVLSDFSVHSFSSLGNDGFWLILVGVLMWTFIPLGLLLLRNWDIPKRSEKQESAAFLSRETGFAAAGIIIGLIGFFVALGMSGPLITKLWSAKGQAAEPEFYNKALYAPAIGMLLLMAAAPFLTWKNGDAPSAYKKLFPAYITAIVLAMGFTGVGMYLGLRHPAMVLLFAASLFCVIANGILIAPRLKSKGGRLSIGGHVAHAGIGLLLAGLAGLVMFSKHKEGILLIKNQPTEALGYKLTYEGYTMDPFARDNAIRIKVVDGNSQWDADPHYAYVPWEGKDSPQSNPPAIHHKFWGDVYLALSGEAQEFVDQQDATSSNWLFSLKRGETKTFGDYTFTLMGYDLDEKAKAVLAKHSEAEFNKLSAVRMVANVIVTYQGKQTPIKVAVRHEPSAGGAYSEVVEIPGPGGKHGRVILRMLPAPTEKDIKEKQSASEAAVARAKEAGAPGTPAFQQALMKDFSAYNEGRRMQEFATYETLRFETFNAPDPGDAVFVELSTKPLIWFIWVGTLLYTLGGFIAYRRRITEITRIKE